MKQVYLINGERYILEDWQAEEARNSGSEVQLVGDYEEEKKEVGPYSTDVSVDPATVQESTDLTSGDGSSVFKGTGWGKSTRFVNTGVQQDYGRGTFKPEQTSTFESVPGTETVPEIIPAAVNKE